jgi:hypothetical protein
MQRQGLRCSCGEIQAFIDGDGSLRARHKPGGEGPPVLTLRPPGPRGPGSVRCGACGSELRFDTGAGAWVPKGFEPLPD